MTEQGRMQPARYSKRKRRQGRKGSTLWAAQMLA
jgi:hypothetical protein